MQNINQVVQEIRNKIAADEGLGPEDLQALHDAAKRSGRPDHIALYATAKGIVAESKKGDEDTAPIDEASIAKLETKLRAAGEKAKRTGSVQDREAYVNLKDELALQREIYDKAAKDGKTK